MKEVHKMYIEVLEEEIYNCKNSKNDSDDEITSIKLQALEKGYIEGLQFALEKAKGILPL